MKSKVVILSIDGLTCGGGGTTTAERAIAHTPGVLRVMVNPATEMAYVEYDPAVTSPSRFLSAVHGAGMQAQVFRAS